MTEPLSRASLRPPHIKREAIQEDDGKLAQLAKDNGFATSGGPSAPPEAKVQKREVAAPEPTPKLSLRERRPAKETRSVSFNCKMKPSVKARPPQRSAVNPVRPGREQPQR